MILITNGNTGEPIICTNYPEPGTYLSIVLDARTEVIVPYYQNEDTCFVVKYKLVNIETLKSCIFTETYYPFKGNPRSDKFFSYLRKHLPFHEQDEELIGTREKVKVVWENLGGVAYPIIVQRTFIDTPSSYKDEYLSELDEEEDEN